MFPTTPHILMIYDEAAIRQLYSLYFKVQGFQLSSAANAIDALNEVHTRKFDAIILDIALGDSNGMDLIEPLRVAQPRVPVFIFTRQVVDESTRQDALARGAFQFFSQAHPLDYVVNEIKRAMKLSTLAPQPNSAA